MSKKDVKITVTTPGGERVAVQLEPTHTSQDVLAALVQEGKLAAEDSSGNALRYELYKSVDMSLLAGDEPLTNQGIGDGAELRAKVGTRVAAPEEVRDAS